MIFFSRTVHIFLKEVQFVRKLSVGSMIFFALLKFSTAPAQNEIPLGTWRMHLSYNRINSIAIGNNKIFGAAPNSVMVLDRDDNSITTYSKLNGLTGAGITVINYNQVSGQLFIAYEDGNLDIVKNNVVINFSRLKESTITGSKKINHITFSGSLAYLSADFGEVVFDLLRNEIRETWRDISSTGTTIKIFQSTVMGDSIFLATENGVMAGNLNDNLLDYNNWKRFNQGSFSGTVQFVTVFNGKIYAAINNSGIYHYSNGSWMKESFLQGLSFSSLSAGVTHLFITENNNLWMLDDSNNLSEVTNDLIDVPLSATEDGVGIIWVADGDNGLLADDNGNFVSYLPNGPRNSSAHRLKFYNHTMYSLPGGFSNSFQPLNNNGGFDSFANGQWTNHKTLARDITDIDFIGNDTYLSSFGYGVEVQDANGNSKIFDDTNSSLVNLNPGKNVDVTAVENSADGLWVANYGSLKPLHLMDDNQSWQGFTFPSVAEKYPVDILVDDNAYVWMTLNPLQGGGMVVFDKENSRSAYLNDQSGTGGLPSKSVYSMALDRDGYVWVGTDEGVAYFFDAGEIFSSAVDAIKPIFDNRFLLKSEKITAVEVDGGNRKWMGTNNGVWLFNPTGEVLADNFTTTNSPLISNVINDIEINDETGEVFFATDKGIVSYRGDATEGRSVFSGIKIFPNPVTHAFNGTVGITGLANDAIVKITDVSGKLIWQTQANGGTAAWRLQDNSGRRTSNGIYLVFAATPDGTENIVGKIAIID